MRVRFVQSGGFVGAVQSVDLDTATLPPDDARTLERLVSDSGLETSGVFLSETGRDLHQYEIGIEADRLTSVTLDDSSIPTAARPLLGFLKQRARPGVG